MTVQPIWQPEYWRQRLQTAKHPHHAIFCCDSGLWQRITRRHTFLLSQFVDSNDSILDVGCGWGRLLSMMPETWRGAYCGVDLSPDFISLARHEWPEREFHVTDVRDLSLLEGRIFDWAVLISMRRMVINNMGQDVWDQMQAEIQRHARRLLFLDYEADNQGEVI